MKFLDPLAKPFELKGSNKGVLLIHGFTGSPPVLRFLGKHLNKKGGYTVKAPLLSGHGTSLENMEKASWKDWIADIESAHEELTKQCSEVYVVGYSMGGLLAMILASKVNPDKLALIAPALITTDKKAMFAPIGKYFIKYKNKISVKEMFPEEAPKYDLKYNVGYDKYPLKSICDLLKIEKLAKKSLPKIQCPTLIIQSPKDDLVDPKSGNLIYNKIQSKQKELFWLKESIHICTIGPEKDKIHEKISEFFLPYSNM
ncbi:alpha/beta hydrolase [Patescibacteria group bacterium]